ncbi:MAG: hydroxymethylbilane synthase, partial [Bacteroidota bacterium]|nr:hydroxymethylbilane synthase [Bacteroidota bacterium]
TKELDRALLDNEIDLAVHSLKDVPTQIPDELTIAAVTEREDVHDVFIPNPKYRSLTLKNIPKGGEIATGSLRRRSQLLYYRPDLSIIEIRGNLNTRVEKLKTSLWHGMILAYAGVVRLGWKEIIGEIIPTSISLPAVGQGALGIIARKDNASVLSLLDVLNHQPTRTAVLAERALLRRLEGGCQIPIGAQGTVNGNTLNLEAFVGDIRGKKNMRKKISGKGEECERLGIQLAEQLLDEGAGDILNEIRNLT